MNIGAFITHYRNAIGLVVLVALICGAVAGSISRFAFPQEYSSEMQILVIQKYTLTDSYTASKSAEKISSNLAEVVKTSTFLESVIASKDVDLTDLLLMDEADRRDAWADTLDTAVISNASILKIIAYDENPQHAEQIAEAVAAVLLEKGSEYHGAPDTITLKVVDTALTSTYPTRPNVLLNGAAAAVFGAVCAAVVLFLRGPRRSRGNAFSPNAHASRNEPQMHHTPGAPVHSAERPQADAHSYGVLDVSNFHHRLTSHQKRNHHYIAAEVKTLPAQTVQHLHT